MTTVIRRPDASDVEFNRQFGQGAAYSYSFTIYGHAGCHKYGLTHLHIDNALNEVGGHVTRNVAFDKDGGITFFWHELNCISPMSIVEDTPGI